VDVSLPLGAVSSMVTSRRSIQFAETPTDNSENGDNKDDSNAEKMDIDTIGSLERAHDSLLFIITKIIMIIL
jgi:hypothetical protein